MLDLTCDVSSLRSELVGAPGDSGVGVGGGECEVETSGQGDVCAGGRNISSGGVGVKEREDECGSMGGRVDARASVGGGRVRSDDSKKGGKTQSQVQHGVVDIEAFLSRYRVQGEYELLSVFQLVQSEHFAACQEHGARAPLDIYTYTYLIYIHIIYVLRYTHIYTNA